jgi:ribonucleoside-diphosphate reductase alpha chain
MKIRYGSEESVKVTNKIFEILRDNSYIASSDIAKEKGTFPKYEKEKYLQGYHIQALPKTIRERIIKHGIRNAVLLTVAPTGSTSLVAGVSSGIEPIFEFEYTHNGRLGKQLVYHSLYGEWKKAHPGEDRPDYFVSANDLAPDDHVKIQAVAQEYIDSSISKTVNAPNNHTVEDVKRLYMLAYDMGLKGITYMRDGSRQGVLERIEEKKEKIPIMASLPAIPVTPRVPRPVMLTGVTYKTDSPSGKMYITINKNEKEDPFEVFINIGKSGSDLMALADALGRMISFVLRIHSPVPARERVREIVSELTGIGGARSIGFGENKVRSLPDAIAKVLAKHCNFRVNGKVEDKDLVALKSGHSNGHMTNGKLEVKPGADLCPAKQDAALYPIKQDDAPSLNQLPLPDTGVAMNASSSTTSLFDICPECGSGTLAYEEGCKKCYGCGYSEC